MPEIPDPDNAEQYWHAVFDQLRQGPAPERTAEEEAREQFDHACGELERLIDERREELSRVKWVPLGLATGFSMVLGVLAACGCIDRTAALAGVGVDFALAAYVLERRGSFRKIFVAEQVQERRSEVEQYLQQHPADLQVRLRADQAGVPYAELPLS